MISPETAAYMNALPHPDDTAAWNERCARMFSRALGQIAIPNEIASDEPLPFDGMEGGE